MEQCTHLVRISEQRRQENLSLQAKMRVIENRSRELLQQQETTTSSAVVGLFRLGSRLESLLDRLVKSYSISEADIEVCLSYEVVGFSKLLFFNLFILICFLIFFFYRTRFILTKLIQMETVVVVILSNLMVL